MSGRSLKLDSLTNRPVIHLYAGRTMFVSRQQNRRVNHVFGPCFACEAISMRLNVNETLGINDVHS
jgi:hypothetical protein